jgi:predicted deacylase
MSTKSEFSWLPVTTLSDGSELRLPLHVLKGEKSGPTLGLTALIHGDEPLPSVPIIRRVLESIDPAELSGTVMAMPVCNPMAAGVLARNSPLDGANLNAVFAETGEDSTIMPVRTVSEQIGGVLIESFLPHLDFHIDFHAGDDGLAVHMVEFTDDPDSTAMARAFNMPILLRDEWGANQFWGASARLGAKVIVAEVGGGGLLYSEWFERGVRGVFNVMRRLGMLPGEVEKPPRQYVVNNTHGHHRNLVLLRQREGGLLLPHPAINARASFDGEPVAAVPYLAQLVNPYDLTIHETYETPFARTLMLAAAVGPAWRTAGDTVYILADADEAEVLG